MKRSVGRGQMSEIISLGIRLLVSGLFLYSGWVKLLDLEAFALAISGYQILPTRLVIPLAYFLPWLEIWCALALWIAPPFRRSAWLLITAMLLVFTVAKISVLNRGLDISCGCSGSDDPMTWKDVGSNLFWMVLSILGLIKDRRG